MDNKTPVKLYSKLNANQILILAFIIDRCEYNCWYCYNEKPRSDKILDLDYLYDLILYVHLNTNKKISLDLIGGEPTLHPNIENFIIKIFNTDYIKCNLYTNFCQCYDFYKKCIDNNVELNITYHYSADENEFLSKIKKLLFYLCTLNISVMYEPKCINKSIYVYNKLKQFSGISTLELSLVFSDTKNRKISNYTDAQLKMYNEITKDSISEKNEYIIKYDTGEEEEVSFYKLQNTNISTKNWKCYAGIEFLDIDVNGNVFSCSVIKKKLFNLYDKKSYYIPQYPTICNNIYCQCKWDITKERIFK